MWIIIRMFVFTEARQPNVDLGCLTVDVAESHIIRYTTAGRTPLDEWSSRRMDFYLHNTNKYKNLKPRALAGFEPAIPESERPQTYVLDRAANRNKKKELEIRCVLGREVLCDWVSGSWLFGRRQETLVET